jgi:uncharacterized membrane protein YebE (DUF533 family)
MTLMAETLSTPDVLDLSGLTERQRLAFYGALFALAAADDAIDERESDQILESLQLDGLSEEARERAFALSISPPPSTRASGCSRRQTRPSAAGSC